MWTLVIGLAAAADPPVPRAGAAAPPPAPEPTEAPAPAPAPPTGPTAAPPAPVPAPPAPAVPAPPAPAPAAAPPVAPPSAPAAPPAPAEAPPPAAETPPAEPPPPAAPDLEPEVPAPRGRRVVDRVAAAVNEDIVTLSEVYELGGEFVASRCPGQEASCVRDAELEILDALLLRTLIRQELGRLGMDVTATDVDRAIDQTVQQYGLPDRQALRQEIEGNGTRWDAYRAQLEEYLRGQAFQGRVLAPRVTVTQDELRDQYQRVARKVKTPTAKVSGFGIGIPADATPEEEAKIVEEAHELVALLNSGGMTWEAAVEEFDVGVTSMFQGQTFTPTSIVESLATAVFSAEAGKVQEPVRVPTPNGVDVLFVLRVDELGEQSEVLPFEEVKAQLEEQVFQEKLQAAQDEWYQRARREAAVSVKL